MPESSENRYPPIADYALLSDCHSAALVSRSGSVDWACLRRFDAASSFGRLLDWERGGYFALTPRGLRRRQRRYIGYSLVLETTLETDTGSARVLDGFAMRRGAGPPFHQLLRVVVGVEGVVTFDVVVEPRFDYGELRPWLRHHADTGAWSAVGGDTALVLSTPTALSLDSEQVRLTGTLEVEADKRYGFSVQAQVPHELEPVPRPQREISDRLDRTVEWWRKWSVATAVSGRWEGAVRRSANVLKGLTCAPTGAIVAAPTTSLPEQIGGGRNWDYRFSWVRDSQLVLAALDIAGHPEAAAGFRDFLIRTTAGSASDLRIMYGPYGERYLPEIELDLEGYRGSRPVRVGNAAFRQDQHDLYGQILEAAHLWRQTHDELADQEWKFLRQLVNRAADVWRRPDHGIWEMRGEPRHFVHSKVWLWVALDRGIRIVEDTKWDAADVERWRATRDEIRRTVFERGVDPDGGWFVQAFDTGEVDAALLELPMVGFVAATDDTMVRTVERIRSELAVGPHGFLHRYRTDTVRDGLAGDEGSFLMCSFWLADVLARQGRQDEAEQLFDALLATANDVGLLSEQHDPASGELLGNFPQAFTHMALINTAHQLQCSRHDHTGCRRQPWTTADRLEQA